MAPGAPMNVSPFAGMIWPNWPVPRVCLPGANQYVVWGWIVQLWARTPSLLSPAGMTTAPLGGDEGPPPRIALLPHTRTGGGRSAAGDPGPAAEEAGPGAVAAGPEERSDVSASQARPATPAARATSTQPMGHLRSWRG